MAARIPYTEVAEAPPVQITDTKVIASFNWEASDLHKFLSPGFPSILEENKGIVQLEKDSQEDLLDQTFHRNEKYPNEVIFRAVEVCDPEFSWRDIGIVTGRNPLRSLVQFLNDSKEAFVFYIDKVGNHCVFTRSYRPPDTFAGYGHYFERANTRMDRTLCNPKDFNCIQSYQLGDLKLVISSEVDAVKPESAVDVLKDQAAHRESAVVEWVSREGSVMQHAKLGSLISKQNYRIYEFKTVNHLACMDERWESIYYQMILGGADSLLLATHRRGRIQKREFYTIDQIRNRVASHDTKLVLGKLGLLLKMIISKVDEMDLHEGHVVVRLEYLPESQEIVLDKLDQTCSKLPEWVVKKLQSE